MPMLETKRLCKNFAGIAAVSELDMYIEAGEILAVVGPNGSGKTTLFNLISGFLPPTSGTITFEGNNINRVPAYQRARSGLVRTFQQAMSFGNLSVYENVELALIASGVNDANIIDRVLTRCKLKKYEDHSSRSLPYGLQRKLGVAIALATQPRLLLLDEPAQGLDDVAREDLAELIRGLRDDGVTIAVIDHDMPFVLPIADRVMVLDAGRKLSEGSADHVRNDQKVIEVYLGSSGD